MSVSEDNGICTAHPHIFHQKNDRKQIFGLRHLSDKIVVACIAKHGTQDLLMHMYLTGLYHATMLYPKLEQQTGKPIVMPRETYTLEIERPENCTETELKEYISDALASHGGAFYKEDPLFGGLKDVKVRRVSKMYKETRGTITRDSNGRKK